MLNCIGVLTSGGDSPGMNATTRAVVRTALFEGAEVWGIHNGYRGILDGEMFKMERKDVGDIIQRGGTFLGTGRSKRFHTEEGRKAAMEKLKEHGIEGLVVIGGDGSLTGAAHLSRHGMPIVGLPATIENDVWGTDYTIGADTAANTVLEAINKLRDTASAHRRIILIEVMGKKSGWLAMMAGVAGGAEYVLVPEVKYDLDEICTEIMDAYEAGKKYSIIVVAQGAGSAVEMGKFIGETTKIDTRVSVLGYIQRGGAPTVEDRMKASLLGERAALALMSGASDIVFGFDMGKVVSINLHDAVTNRKTLDPEIVRLARVLA